MKKLFSALLAFTMIFSLCSCAANSRESLVKNTPLLNLEELWKTTDQNEAKAISEYDKKQYRLTLRVAEIDKTYFKAFDESNSYTTRYIRVELSTEELAALTKGDKITVLGKIDLRDENEITIKDAFITTPYEEKKEFSPEEIEKAIADFGGDGGDGIVEWTEGSYPFFMDNQESFEEIPWEALYAILAGKWSAKHYSPEEFEIDFNSTTSATLLRNGKTETWDYEILNDRILLPKHRNSVSYHEVRKVSDNLLVFYNNPTQSWTSYPMLILYR